MKKIAFIADFFREEVLGGGESNDANLINFLSKQFVVKYYKSNVVTIEDIDNCDGIVIGNFILLPSTESRISLAELIKSSSHNELPIL